MKRLNLPVSESVHAAVKEVAERQGMKVYAVVERAVCAGLRSEFGCGVAYAHKPRQRRPRAAPAAPAAPAALGPGFYRAAGRPASEAGEPGGGA